jgi:hypothetical protein
VRYDKLAHRVNNFGLPLGLAFVLRIAMALIRLQCHHFQILHAFVMERFGMTPDFPLQACDHAWVYLR